MIKQQHYYGHRQLNFLFSVMNDYKFATYGRLGDEFKTLIDNHYPALECINFETQDELYNQLHKFNAFAGFGLTADIDISHIQWIHSFGAGVDAFTNLQLPAELLLTRTSGNMGLRMAEYCLAYILNEFKSVGKVYQNQLNKEWTPLQLKDLNTSNILVFGTGTIGSAIAHKLQPLVNLIDGVNRSGMHVSDYNAVFKLGKSIDLSRYDVIINTLPDTPETKDMFNDKLFALCNDTIFINVGRGESVEQQALLKALNAGKIKTAILDVFAEEPLSSDSPLWSHPSVIVTPHHASKTSAHDVGASFSKIVEAIKSGSSNELFVDLSKGY